MKENKLVLHAIVDWFHEYQGDCDDGEMVRLYHELIKEETDELMDAVEENDLVEVLDAYADLVWVSIGLRFFHYRLRGYDLSSLDPYETFDMIVGIANPLRPLILECIGEVARSNYTKSKDLSESGTKKGKVIKGENYRRPDLVSVIYRYFSRHENL